MNSYIGCRAEEDLHWDKFMKSVSKYRIQCVSHSKLKQRREERETHRRPMCASSFTATSHLNIRILFHTGVKPFSCQQCEYKCTTNGDLKKHTLTHSGEKPFTCMQCEFFCTTARDLKRHIAHPYTGRAVSLRYKNTRIQSIRCLIHLFDFPPL